MPLRLAQTSAGSGGDRRDWERSATALLSMLTGVKLRAHRDREGAVLVRRPQDTQFCLAVKRLNCTFAFLSLSVCVFLSASQLWSVSGGVRRPEMRWRVLSLNKIDLIAATRQRSMGWTASMEDDLVLSSTDTFLSLSLFLSAYSSSYMRAFIRCALLSMAKALRMFFLSWAEALGISSVFKIQPRAKNGPCSDYGRWA